MSIPDPLGTQSFKDYAKASSRGTKKKSGLISISGFFKYISLVFSKKSTDEKATSLYNHLLKDPDPDVLRWASTKVLESLAKKVDFSTPQDEKNRFFIELLASSHTTARSEKKKNEIAAIGASFFQQPGPNPLTETYVNLLDDLTLNLSKVVPKLSPLEVKSAEERFRRAYVSPTPWYELTKDHPVETFTQSDWVISETLANMLCHDEINTFYKDVTDRIDYHTACRLIKAFGQTVLSKNRVIISEKLDAAAKPFKGDWKLYEFWVKDSAVLLSITAIMTDER